MISTVVLVGGMIQNKPEFYYFSQFCIDKYMHFISLYNALDLYTECNNADLYTFPVDMFSDGGKDIALANYTPTWKLHRALSSKALRYSCIKYSILLFFT